MNKARQSAINTLTEVFDLLNKKGLEEEADKVAEVLDQLEGWCHEDFKLC